MNVTNFFAQFSDQLPTLVDHLPHILQPEVFPSTLLSNATSAALTFVSAELGRDTFHYLGHRWRGLIPHHRWHHTAYKRGYIKRLSHYFTSLWHHEVPESITMVGITGGCFLTTLYQSGLSDFRIGCAVILLHTLRELGIKLLRTGKVQWAIKADKNHQPQLLTAPPSQWWVNASYHYRHHFSDTNAYFSGIISLLDKLLKTAISLKGRKIGFVGDLGGLEEPLRQELQQAGAHLIPQNHEIDFEDTTILVLDLSAIEDGGPQAIIRQMEQFLATIDTDEEIISKEIWLVLTEAEIALAYTSLDALYQRYLSDWMTRRRLNAPCILRKIVIGNYRGRRPGHAKVARSIVGLVQRDMRNIVVKAPLWTYLLQPLKEWMVSTYFRFSQ